MGDVGNYPRPDYPPEKEKPVPLSRNGFFLWCKISVKELQFYNILGLLTLRSFSDFKLNFLTFFEGFVSFTLNFSVMNEYIVSFFRCDEAVTFLVTKPFNCSCCHNLLLLSTKT